MLATLALAATLAQDWPSKFPPGAPEVELVQTEAGWQILKEGEPFYVRGAGAHIELLDELAAAGANSIRTWGAGEDLWPLLDRAHELGLSVVIGQWLNKQGDNFDYDTPADRERQYADAERIVQRFKDHPALLMWAVGNEMELGAPDERVWEDVERIAQIYKANDPGRPVMTVVADMWPEKMDAILRNCPSIDLLGVNSYGGLPTLESRMTRWTKPYLITEYHFSGRNEETDFGLIVEPNSTQKAEGMADNYRNAILAYPGRVLGGHFFHWSASSTQIGSLHAAFTRTGERLQVVEELGRLWGVEPSNRAPRIVSVEPVRQDRTYAADVVDPDGDSLTYELEVIREVTEERFVGDFERPQEIVYARVVGPRFTLPELQPGTYRAFLIVRDGQGNAAVWNKPLLVPAPEWND